MRARRNPPSAEPRAANPHAPTGGAPALDQAGTAIQNAPPDDPQRSATRSVERERTRAEALAAVGRAISASLDLDEVLSLVVERATAATGAEAAAVLQGEPATGDLRFRQAHGLTTRPLDRFVLRAGSGIAGAALAAGHPVWTYDLQNDPRFRGPGDVISIAAAEGLRGVVCVPIRGGTEPFGVLSLYWRSPHVFDQEEIAFAARIADQAAIAIENARLYEDSRRRAREAAALARVARTLTESLDTGAVAERIVESVLSIMDVRSAGFRLLRPDGSLVALAADASGAHAASGNVVAPGMGISGRVVAEGAPVWCRDVLSDPQFLLDDEIRHRIAASGLHAFLGVPLRVKGAIIGALTVADRTGRAFAAAEVELLETFAAQAAIAIENARLYEESRRQAREATALADVGRALSESLDMDRVLERIAVQVRQMMEAAFVGVMGLDEASQELSYVAGVGLPRERFAPLRIKVGDGIAGRAVAQRAPIHIPDLLLDPRPVSPMIIRTEGYRSVFCAPLIAGDRVLGCINVFRPEAGEFTPAEVQLLTRFADQAAIAIENARLYAEVTDQAGTLEERVRERTVELERANQAKSEFLANMSHELRTPLNAIIGFSQMLQMQTFGPLAPKQERYVGNIQAAGVHLLNLVNDILDLARVEAGRLELRREATALSPAIAQALDGVRPLAEKKVLALACEVDTDLPPLWADPVRLHQILSNLLSNAVKFTPEGGRVTVRATRAPAPADACLEVSVQDTGSGIAPEDLGRLFRKFEQLDAGAAKAHQGTGLGLALTRRLVELHGGSIAADSPGLGRGSTFTVRLPASPQRERPALLIADDDRGVRDLLIAAAHEWGWDAEGAATLAEARAALDRALPDLLVLDVSLPDGSGLAFARELRRALARRVPILMYTGLEAEEGQTALQMGADDYLVKPAPLDVIQRKASKLLARAGWPVVPAGSGAPGGDPPPDEAHLRAGPRQAA